MIGRKGWFFLGDNGRTVLFQSTGRRNYGTGALDFVGEFGACWTAIPFPGLDEGYNNLGRFNGRFMGYHSVYVGPQGGNNMAYAYSVRPVRDGNAISNSLGPVTSSGQKSAGEYDYVNGYFNHGWNE